MIATTRASLSFSEALLGTNVAWVHIISTNFDIISINFDILLALVLVSDSGKHYFQYTTSNIPCYWSQELIFSMKFMLPLLSRIPYFHSQHCQYNITNIACYLMLLIACYLMLLIACYLMLLIACYLISTRILLLVSFPTVFMVLC